jgi:hypothetical protein
MYRVGQNRMYRVGQNRIYTPYMTVHLVIPLPKTPYIQRIYMVLANPMYVYTVYLAISLPNIPTVSTPYIYMYGSGQPYM